MMTMMSKMMMEEYLCWNGSTEPGIDESWHDDNDDDEDHDDYDDVIMIMMLMTIDNDAWLCITIMTMDDDAWRWGGRW